MRRALSQIFRYPFSGATTRRQFFILTLLSFIPFLGSVLLGPFATAAVSAITIEKNESAELGTGILIARAWRAFLAGFITLLYLLPAFALLTWMGFSFWHSGKITLPVIFLFLYAVLVIGALPFAALHAVTCGSIWAALELPKLIAIGLKINFSLFFKVLVVSLAVFALKLFLVFLGPIGDILFGPLKAYSEYVFQYLLAISYLDVVERV